MMTSVPRRDEISWPPSDRQWRPGHFPWLEQQPSTSGRTRVIVDNDFSGDPDDLFQLVHHLLSPVVDIRLVVASHLRPGDPLDDGPDTALNASLVALDVLARMGHDATELIATGSSEALTDTARPVASEAARRIVAEAMREDGDTELVYAAGGGLTDLASAILMEPRVVDRMRVIWIGGEEHPDLAYPPPAAMPIEYNLLIDVPAAQVVFDSGMEIWQVPRDVYRQCLVSDVELRRRVRDAGALGRYLYEETRAVMDDEADAGRPSETYALGDSPLVLLTALRSTFEPDTTSSRYVLRPTPSITADGAYRAVAGRRAMRVYTQVDTRLMFEDMYLKLAEFCSWQDAAE